MPAPHIPERDGGETRGRCNGKSHYFTPFGERCDCGELPQTAYLGKKSASERDGETLSDDGVKYATCPECGERSALTLTELRQFIGTRYALGRCMHWFPKAVIRRLIAVEDALTELAALRAECARLTADKERLDAISRLGAATRVFTRALENKADPKTVLVAEARIPMSPHSDIVCERRTLREAIDGASNRAARAATPGEANND